ncbi:hypothetical protein [Pseudomonas sp. PD9R]|jgi:hypothetical protein|nr:hypothetical protein [Pseudomonas sp. PD9R]MBV6823511.1 hypothetical protein [Pseudomonas sp. PD9R]
MSDPTDLINPARRKVFGQTLALSAATLIGGGGLGITSNASASARLS